MEGPTTTRGGSSTDLTSGDRGATRQLDSSGELLKHLLVSASYSGRHHLISGNVKGQIQQLIEDGGGEFNHAVVYATSHFIHPAEVSLTDSWQALDDEDRKLIKERMPRLFTAIFLAIRGTVPPGEVCDSTSPNGSLCLVRGDHESHSGPSGRVVDGMETTEVWT